MADISQRYPCDDELHLQEVPVGVSPGGFTFHTSSLSHLCADATDVHLVSVPANPAYFVYSDQLVGAEV